MEKVAQHDDAPTYLPFGVDGDVDAEAKSCQREYIGKRLDTGMQPHKASKGCCPYQNGAQREEKSESKAHKGSMRDDSIVSSWIYMFLFLLSASYSCFKSVSDSVSHRLVNDKDPNQPKRKIRAKIVNLLAEGMAAINWLKAFSFDECAFQQKAEQFIYMSL